MTPSRWSGPGWDTYLRQFHEDRPGITEAVLTRCYLDHQTPYQWLSEGVTGQGLVLDLACGSAPARQLSGAGWVGVDASMPELVAAGPDTAGRVVQGDLVRLPFRGDACSTAVCSMALMLVEPLDEALAEIRRVLLPGGVLRLLLPAHGPITVRDRARYTSLAVVLGTFTLLPPSPLLRTPGSRLDEAGLTVRAAHSRRFAYPIRSTADAARLVDSLYLPDVSPRRRQAARRLAAHWTSSDLGIPLTRVIATLAPAEPSPG